MYKQIVSSLTYSINSARKQNLIHLTQNIYTYTVQLWEEELNS